MKCHISLLRNMFSTYNPSQLLEETKGFFKMLLAHTAVIFRKSKLNLGLHIRPITYF